MRPALKQAYDLASRDYKDAIQKTKEMKKKLKEAKSKQEIAAAKKAYENALKEEKQQKAEYVVVKEALKATDEK